MTNENKNAQDATAGARMVLRRAVIDAALPHVVFDGWTDKTLAVAVQDSGVDPAASRLEFPRGGVDLALAYHYLRDADLRARLGSTDLALMRFRDRVSGAVMTRLELVAGEREEVRRAVALFALPNHATDGARAIWHTADTIWTALGDTSRDINWYTKRTTLSAVYSSALLYWLGDDSEGSLATRAFVDRRIEDVMRIEGVKARIARNPLAAAMMKAPMRFIDRVKAPEAQQPDDLPGSCRRRV